MTSSIEESRKRRKDEATRMPGGEGKVFIKSYGCQMNVYDSTLIEDTLAREGYTRTDDADSADVVVLNTCHIRERASEKIFSELGRVKETKIARAARGEATMVVVAGCVAQADGGEILRRQPAVDVVVGTQSYGHLPDALRRAREKPGVVVTEFAAREKFDSMRPAAPEVIRSRGPSAFVTVQEGCDKFCAFCVVPYTRGAEISRPVVEILDEIEKLVDSGVREVTLLGQNVNAYHGRDPRGRELSLAGLIERIADVGGVRRIRYTTSHPLDFGDDLVRAHGDIEKLMPYVHLPVQAGSDRILAAMNRRHRARDYLDIIDKLRRVRPDIAISSDFIVGFPGETRAEFEATLDLVRAVGFASAFSFKYSARPGTPAATLGTAVEEAEKSDRLFVLQTLLEEQRRAFNAGFLGAEVEALFEKPGRHDGQIVGKTPHLQTVFTEAPARLIGEIARLSIVEMNPNSFRGRVVTETVS